jgi:hypothetical protein
MAKVLPEVIRPTGPEPTVTLVIGTTGEYSDRREWVVKAYADSYEASMLVFRLESIVKYHLGPAMDDFAEFVEFSEMLILDLQALDPGVSVDYNGVHYRTVEVPFAPSTGD